MTIDDRKLTPSPGDERDHARAKALEWIVAGTELNLDNLASLIQRERAEARREALAPVHDAMREITKVMWIYHEGDSCSRALYEDITTRIVRAGCELAAGKPETGEGG